MCRVILDFEQDLPSLQDRIDVSCLNLFLTAENLSGAKSPSTKTKFTRNTKKYLLVPSYTICSSLFFGVFFNTFLFIAIKIFSFDFLVVAPGQYCELIQDFRN
jgi:hypothetical protein